MPVYFYPKKEEYLRGHGSGAFAPKLAEAGGKTSGVQMHPRPRSVQIVLFYIIEIDISKLIRLESDNKLHLHSPFWCSHNVYGEQSGLRRQLVAVY